MAQYTQDSQDALRSIASKTVRSKTVMSYQEVLSWLRHAKISIGNTESNMEGDRLAKLGGNNKFTTATHLTSLKMP